MRVFLARHGQTNFNKEERIQGTLDSSTLTVDGIAQVRRGSRIQQASSRRQNGAECAHVRRLTCRCCKQVAGLGYWLTQSAELKQLDRTWCSPMHR